MADEEYSELNESSPVEEQAVNAGDLNWQPDFNSPDPYANAPDWYKRLVLKTYVPTPENPLSPVETPQETPVETPTPVEPPPVLNTDWQPNFNSDENGGNPYAGMPPEYKDYVEKTYVPTTENPVAPTTQVGAGGITTQTKIDEINKEVNDIIESGSSLTPESQQMVNAINDSSLQKYWMIDSNGQLGLNIGMALAGGVSIALLKSLGYSDEEIAKARGDWDNYIGTIKQNEDRMQEYHRQLNEYLDILKRDNPDAYRVYMNAGGGEKGILAASNSINASIQKAKDENIKIINDIANNKGIPSDNIKDLITKGELSPEVLAVAGYDINAINDAINEIKQEYDKYLLALSKLAPYNTGGQVVGGHEIDLEGNPILDESGKIPKSVLPVNYSIENLAKFVRDNPDDTSTLKTLNFSDKIINAVYEFNKKYEDTKNEINSVIGGNGSASNVLALGVAIDSTGINSYDVMTGAGYKVSGALEIGTKWVDKDGHILTDAQVNNVLWNSLTQEQKDSVIKEYEADYFKSDYLAEYNNMIHKGAEGGGLLSNIAFGGVFPITDVVSKQLTLNEAKDYLGNQYKIELEAVKDYIKTDGTVDIEKLSSATFYDDDLKKKILDATGYENIDDLKQNLQYYNSGIKVTAGEWATAGVVGALDIIGMGGGELLAGAGTAGRIVSGVIQVGAGVYFLPSAIKVAFDPKASVGEKVLAVGGSVALIGGGALSFKAPKISSGGKNKVIETTLKTTKQIDKNKFVVTKGANNLTIYDISYNLGKSGKMVKELGSNVADGVKTAIDKMLNSGDYIKYDLKIDAINTIRNSEAFMRDLASNISNEISKGYVNVVNASRNATKAFLDGLSSTGDYLKYGLKIDAINAMRNSKAFISNLADNIVSKLDYAYIDSVNMIRNSEALLRDLYGRINHNMAQGYVDAVNATRLAIEQLKSTGDYLKYGLKVDAINAMRGSEAFIRDLAEQIKNNVELKTVDIQNVANSAVRDVVEKMQSTGDYIKYGIRVDTINTLRNSRAFLDDLSTKISDELSQKYIDIVNLNREITAKVLDDITKVGDYAKYGLNADIVNSLRSSKTFIQDLSSRINQDLARGYIDVVNTSRNATQQFLDGLASSGDYLKYGIKIDAINALRNSEAFIRELTSKLDNELSQKYIDIENLNRRIVQDFMDKLSTTGDYLKYGWKIDLINELRGNKQFIEGFGGNIKREFMQKYIDAVNKTRSIKQEIIEGSQAGYYGRPNRMAQLRAIWDALHNLPISETDYGYIVNDLEWSVSNKDVNGLITQIEDLKTRASQLPKQLQESTVKLLDEAKQQGIEYIKQLEDTDSWLYKFNRDMVRTKEPSTFSARTISAEEAELWKQISIDTQRAQSLMQSGDVMGELSTINNRIAENMRKIFDMTGEKTPVKDMNLAVDSRLRDLGYDWNDIKRMTETQKLEIVANNKVKGVKDFLDPEVVDKLEKAKSQLDAEQNELNNAKQLREKATNPETKTKLDEQIAKREQDIKTKRQAMVDIQKETKTTIWQRVVTPEEQEASKLIVHEKPKTSDISIRESVKEKITEKISRAEKQEADTAYKRIFGESARNKPSTVVPFVEPAFYEPREALVWENGEIKVKLITPEKMEYGVIISLDDDVARFNELVDELSNKMTYDQAVRLASEEYLDSVEKFDGITLEQLSEQLSSIQDEKKSAGAAPALQSNQQLQEDVYSQLKNENRGQLINRIQNLNKMQSETLTANIAGFKSETDFKELTKIKPPIIEFNEDEGTKRKLQNGFITWRQGKTHWAIPQLPDGSFNSDDKIPSGLPFVGTTKFAKGKGSVYATMEYVGKNPPKKAFIDLGWAQFNVVGTSGGLQVNRIYPDEEANWDGTNRFTTPEAIAERKEREREERIARYKKQYIKRPLRKKQESEPDIFQESEEILARNNKDIEPEVMVINGQKYLGYNISNYHVGGVL